MKRARPPAVRKSRVSKPSSPEPLSLVAVPPVPLHIELAQKLAGLPPDVGALLVGAGAAGLIIPGPIPPGTPFLVLGTVILCPALVVKLGAWLARKWPALFRFMIAFIHRFRLQLARRYPGRTTETSRVLVPASCFHVPSAGAIGRPARSRVPLN